MTETKWKPQTNTSVFAKEENCSGVVDNKCGQPLLYSPLSHKRLIESALNEWQGLSWVNHMKASFRTNHPQVKLTT